MASPEQKSLEVALEHLHRVVEPGACGHCGRKHGTAVRFECAVGRVIEEVEAALRRCRGGQVFPPNHTA